MEASLVGGVKEHTLSQWSETNIYYVKETVKRAGNSCRMMVLVDSKSLG